MKKLKCYKCGTVIESNAIYQMMCTKRQGGCSKLVQVKHCELIKEVEKNEEV